MFVLGLPELIIIVLGIAAIGFEIAMLVHIVKNKQFSMTKKALWIIALLVFYIFAAAYYYFAEYRHSSGSVEAAA